MPSQAFINPQMLSWARDRVGLSIAALAQKMKPIRPERIAAWEHGDEEDRPTFKQAQRLAYVLRVPFGYLFLAEAPPEDLPLPDLRTKRDAATLNPSPDFLDVVYDSLRKQEWYHEYLEEQDAAQVPFVGKHNAETPVNLIADDIRHTLGIDDDLRREAKDNDEYFRLLVRQCERAGILVLRSGIVGNNTTRPLDADEFQGFAIADDLAPVVFVNQNDYLSAQIFTLLHEVAHLWIGVSGVSDPDYLERPASNEAIHQRFADQIAAEALVPSTEFSTRWDQGHDDATRVGRLRRHYKVSVFVLLRRAYDLGKMSRSKFLSEYDEQRLRIKPKPKGGGGGYNLFFSRNSYTVTAAVLHSLVAGTLPPTEGATLLNVRPMTLYNMERFLSLREL